MLDSVDPAEIRRAIANGARPDALLGYSDGRFDDYQAIAAEAGGLPVYALDVNGNTADAEGEDTEPGNIGIPGAVRCLVAEKARGVDRPIGYCPESEASALVAEAGRQGLSGSVTAAGRTDWRLVTAHYGDGPHICGPGTCGCPVEANGTQWADSGPHGENVDQSVLDDRFLTAASHPGPSPTSTPEDPDMIIIHDTQTQAQYTTDGATKTYIGEPATLQALIARLGPPVDVDHNYAAGLAGRTI